MKLKKIVLTSAVVLGVIIKTYGQDMNELDKVRPYSITFSVADLELTADWYIQKLGFRRVQEKNYPQFKTSLVFLELNGYRVELIKDGNAKDKIKTRPTPPSHTSIMGQSQFCFLTENLNELKKELENKGIGIEWEFKNDELGVKFLFIRDPEGNLIQYLQKLR